MSYEDRPGDWKLPVILFFAGILATFFCAIEAASDWRIGQKQRESKNRLPAEAIMTPQDRLEDPSRNLRRKGT